MGEDDNHEAVSTTEDAGVDSAAEAPKKRTKTKTKTEPPTVEKTEGTGFCVYLGPTIRGVMQEGAIFPCTKREAFERAELAIQKYPEIANLIVHSSTLSEDRTKIKTPGNLLYHKRMQMISGK